VLRAVTDEIMYALMDLSGQEYVDRYAQSVKTELEAAAKEEKKEQNAGAKERKRAERARRKARRKAARRGKKGAAADADTGPETLAARGAEDEAPSPSPSSPPDKSSGTAA